MTFQAPHSIRVRIKIALQSTEPGTFPVTSPGNPLPHHCRQAFELIHSRCMHTHTRAHPHTALSPDYMTFPNEEHSETSATPGVLHSQLGNSGRSPQSRFADSGLRAIKLALRPCPGSYLPVGGLGKTDGFTVEAPRVPYPPHSLRQFPDLVLPTSRPASEVTFTGAALCHPRLGQLLPIAVSTKLLGDQQVWPPPLQMVENLP